MKQPIVVSLKGRASGAEALMYMKAGTSDPPGADRLFADLHAAAFGQVAIRWRELTPISVLASTSSCCGTTPATAEERQEFITAAKARPAVQMGGTGSSAGRIPPSPSRSSPARNSPTCPIRRAARRPSSSATHCLERQQSVGESRSVARQPGARAVRVRQGAHRYRPRSPATGPGTTCRPARRKASTCST